jgi:hypothetical protein
MKIELDLPEIEGYEYTGEYRTVEAYDYYLEASNEAVFQPPNCGKTIGHYPILKKKAPKYAILKGAAFEKEYVEKKVVRDLMVIVEQINSGAEFDLTGFANYLEIKELLN